MADIHAASIKASHAARHLAMAAARDMDRKGDNIWLGLGVESLIETANALGYIMIRTFADTAKPATTDTEAV